MCDTKSGWTPARPRRLGRVSAIRRKSWAVAILALLSHRAAHGCADSWRRAVRSAKMPQNPGGCLMRRPIQGAHASIRGGGQGSPSCYTRVRGDPRSGRPEAPSRPRWRAAYVGRARLYGVDGRREKLYGRIFQRRLHDWVLDAAHQAGPYRGMSRGGYTASCGCKLRIGSSLRGGRRRIGRVKSTRRIIEEAR